MTRFVIFIACILFPTFAGLSRSDVALYHKAVSRYSWLNYHTFVIVAEQSRVHGLRPELVLAVIDAESDGRTHAVSRTGARGLMQVMAKYWYAGNEQDLHIPRVGISRGCAALRWAHDVAGGSLLYTLRNYERGPRGKGFNVRYIARIENNLEGL